MFESFLASVDALNLSLEEGRLDDERLKADCERITTILQSGVIQRMLSLHDEDSSKRNELYGKITHSAVKLWNTAVGKNSGKSVSSRSNAFLRQVCFDLASCAVIKTCNADKIDIRRNIMMGIKVGRAWHEAREDLKSLEVLETTKIRIESLLEKITNGGNPDWYVADKMSLQQDLFSVLCAMSEATSSLSCHEDVVKLVEKAANLPIFSGNSNESRSECNGEIEKLCGLTYNFGLKSAGEQRYAEAVDWLTRSFDAGKRGITIRPSVMAKILRLLSHCYSEMRSDEGDEKALNALELAEGYGSHPGGIHLKLKILVRNNATPNEVIEPALHELFFHRDASIDLSLSACRYLNSHKRFVLCEEALEMLQQKYAKSPQAAKIQARRFEYKLARLEGNEALDIARLFLKDEQTILDMDRDSKKSVFLLLWEQAEKHQEKGDADCAMSWYDLSLRLHGLGDDGNSDGEVAAIAAKIQRNRSSCLIGLGRLHEARLAAEESARMDGKNARSDFAMFKVAICEGNQSEALEMITRLAKKFNYDMEVDGQEPSKDTNATIHGLVCLCAQLAFEKKEHSVAISALRHVADSTDNRTAKMVALRSLVRLYVRQMEVDEPRRDNAISTEGVMINATTGIEEALKVLLDISSRPLREKEIESRRQMTFSSPSEKSEATTKLLQDEADWFTKISWNMALESKPYPRLMRKLFFLSYQFLELHDTDIAVLTRQKTCLLMSSSAALEVARCSSNKKEMEDELKFALDCLEKHKLICSRLQSSSPSTREEKESLMRALYEFEARAKLASISQPDDGKATSEMEELERLFESIISLAQASVKTLETIAYLCTELPANHVNLSKRALKTAIEKLEVTLNTPGDHDMRQLAIRYGTLYRTLVGLAVRGGSDSDPVAKEEALMYVREASELIEKLEKFYPEHESLWLAVKSWNIGARLFAADHVIPAEKWCSSAMRLLVHLRHYRANYDAHMSEIYQEILAKKNSLMLGDRGTYLP